MLARIVAATLAVVAGGCVFDRSGFTPRVDCESSIAADVSTDRTDFGLPALILDGLLDDDGAPRPWWDPSWKRRRRLTFLNAGGKQDLVDFPVLVVLDGTRLDYSAAGMAGEDLRFVDADHATVLAHEIERWQAGQASHVWVRVPRIDKLSSQDHIWLYHGNPGAADGQQAASVWSSAHAGVWHLSGDYDDSTKNASHATNHGAKDAAGEAAGAQAFSGAQYVELPKAASLDLDAFTVSLWFRSSQTWDEADWPGSAMLVTRATSGWCSHDWTVFAGRRDTESGDAGRVIAGNGACTGTGWEPRLFSGTGLNDDKWHQVALVRTPAGDNRLYVDGVEADALKDDGSSVSADRAIQVGGEQHRDNGSYLDGAVDELRVIKGARSAAWIDADHRSVSDALISYGPEERYGR